MQTGATSLKADMKSADLRMCQMACVPVTSAMGAPLSPRYGDAREVRTITSHRLYPAQIGQRIVRANGSRPVAAKQAASHSDTMSYDG